MIILYQVNSFNRAFLVIVFLPSNLLNLAIINSASDKLTLLVVECSKIYSTSSTSIYPLWKYLSKEFRVPSLKNYNLAFYNYYSYSLNNSNKLLATIYTELYKSDICIFYYNGYLSS